MTVILHERAKRVADILMDLQAIHCNPEKPYILTSGWASPVYVNCRSLISVTWQRREIIQMAAELIENHIGSNQIDLIAGGETAGIPFAAWIADYFYKPLIYVRKKHKGFGLRRQVEGELNPGQRVLLVEDLITDGASKVHFSTSLRSAKARVSHIFAVFSYGVYPAMEANLQNANLSLLALTDWRATLEAAKARGYFTPTQVAVVEEFLHDSAGWSKAHNGMSE
jgi:orotate phosphoribosyltransferase